MKPARRKCAHKACRQWFHPVRDGQVVCSFECASAIGKEQTAKAREAAQRKEAQRQRTEEKAGRQRKAAVKPSDIPTLKGYTARLVDQKWLRLAARRTHG